MNPNEGTKESKNENWNGNSNWNWNGSITVEAAMIMPIVVFSVFAMIYLTFYLHDICKIQGLMDKTLHKASLTVKHEADLATGEVYYENIHDRGVFYLILGSTKDEEVQIQKYLYQELSRGLFLSKINAVNVDVGKYKIAISLEAETKVSLSGVKQLFDPFSRKVILGEYSVHNPAETLRQAEVILDTGSKIKGVEELKERLEAVFGL